MPDLDQSSITSIEGQPVGIPDATGTTPTAPATEAGQAAVQGSTPPEQATGTQAEDSFFDPAQLPPELKSVYKQMQSAYTRKTQTLAQQRQKVEAYDAFMRDPVGSLQQVASQYGMQITRAQAAEAIQSQQGGVQQSDQWEPKTWDDVFVRAEERAMEKVMQKLAPVLGNVHKLQANNIEAQLNSIDPNWKIYEDDMRATLTQHPSLVGDVEKLYRLSVPEEVYSTRAVQAALKRIQSTTNQASMASRSSTSRTVATDKVPDSFSEAVELARKQLASQGR